jgi:8-amino-7-oxononanoate synthase
VQPKSLKTFLQESLAKLREKNLIRETKHFDKKSFVDFSSNDYLGLGEKALSPADLYTKSIQDFLFANSCDEELEEGQISLWNNTVNFEPTKHESLFIGSTASRLITGTHPIHERLEAKIASWKKTEAALCFGSGYLANIGAIPALVGPRDLVLSDELNHACILDGIKLSGAKKFFYRHNDIEHLEELLSKHTNHYEKILVITDSVFSMDGDRARLEEIIKLKKDFCFSVYLDEAHATGVLGNTGAGLVEELSEAGKISAEDIEIQMGTFSKAVAVEGAYIAGSEELITFLKNKARSFMFSTAFSPLIANLISQNLESVINRNDLRIKLKTNIKCFQKELKNQEINNWTNEDTSIFSIVVGDNLETLNFSKALLEKGVLVMAIREPTVPYPRLRVCISARHSREEIKQLSVLLKELASNNP